MSKSGDISAVCARIDEIRRNDLIRAFERWRAIGQIVVQDLKEQGQFFNADQGLFLFDSERHEGLALDKNIGLAALLQERYGINPQEYCSKLILANLQSEAHLHGRQIAVRRLAHYDPQKLQLYVSRFDGFVHLLNGESIELVPNGTDDVFFFDERLNWEPYLYLPGTPRGQLKSQLIESVHFVDDVLSIEEQRLLLKIWLLALFFGSIQPTKIILLLLGDHGSGKTSALRRIQKCIFGPRADLLSVEKDKQDAFIATVTTNPIALFDNVDERVGWLPYSLSRLATGVTFPRRQLYTTNTKVEYPGVSWLGITSRSVRFMDNQPDLPDRTLVLKVERLDEKRPEAELLSAIAQYRNAIWSELLEELNAIVGCLQTAHEPQPVNFRMADFAAFALRAAELWSRRAEAEQAFQKLEEAQAELVFEDDPVHQVIELWLLAPPNQGRSLDAGTLNTELAAVSTRNHIPWPFANPKSLGQRLGQLRHALGQKLNLEITRDAHTKQNRYRFWPQGKPAMAEAA